MGIIRTGIQEYQNLVDLQGETLPPQNKDKVNINSVGGFDWVPTVTFPHNGVTVVQQTNQATGRWMQPKAFRSFEYGKTEAEVTTAMGGTNVLKNGQSVEIKFYQEDLAVGSNVNVSLVTDIDTLDGQTITTENSVKEDEDGIYVSVFAENNNDADLTIPSLDISVVEHLGN
jgi:hypothetical protein